MFNNLRKIVSIRLKLAALSIAWLGTIKPCEAQCPNDNTFIGQNLTVTCPGSTTLSMSTGDYVILNVTTGNVYSVSTCGGSQCNTRLTLSNLNGTVYATNDDGSGINCGSGESQITWYSDVTGPIAVLLDDQNCGHLGCAGNSVTITCSQPPSNTSVCGAYDLPVAGSCQYLNFDNTQVGSTFGFLPSCSSFQGNDLWFKVVVGSSGGVKIELSADGMDDSGLSLYTGTGCNNLVEAQCDDDSGPGLMSAVEGAYPEGTELWIRVWGFDGQQGSFNICAYDYTPVYTAQDCNLAIDICQTNGFTISSTGSGQVQEMKPVWSTGGTVGNPNSPPGSSGNSGCLLDGELNSTWLLLTVSKDGLLEFVFGANGTQSGFYDWSMWPFNDNCVDIASETVAPVRCNYNGVSYGGTGIVDQIPTGGDSQNYEAALNVKCGEQYIVCFSNWSAVNTSVDISVSGTADVSCISVPKLAVQDVTICKGDSATLSVAGADVYTWTPNNSLSSSTGSNVLASPQNTQTYTVTGSTGCISSDTTVTVFIDQLPNLSVISSDPSTGIFVNGPDFFICQGNQIHLQAQGSNLGSYTWLDQGNSGLSCTSCSATTVTLPGPGKFNYSVIGYSANACADTLHLTIETSDGPKVAISDTSFCWGDSVLLVAKGASQYSWFPATGLSTTIGDSVIAIPNSTAIYSVVGSQLGCKDDTARIVVTVLPELEVDFTIAGSFCVDGDGLNFLSLVSGATSSSLYKWTFSGSNQQTIAGVTATGITWPSSGTFPVQLSVSDALCSETKVMDVTIRAKPSVVAVANNSGCSGAQGTITAGGGTGSYSWNAGQYIGKGPHHVDTGTYNVVFTDGWGCEAKDTVVLVEAMPISISVSSTDIFCGGSGTGSVAVNNTIGGTPPYTYIWTGGLGVGQSHSAVPAGNYQVTVVDQNNCQDSTSVVVEDMTSLQISSSYSNPTCANTPTGSISLNVSGGSGPYNYSWSGGLTGPNPMAVSAGTYTCIVSDQGNCFTTVAISLVDPNPVKIISISATDPTCYGASNGGVTANAAGGTGGLAYIWLGVGNGATQVGVSAGTYKVYAYDTNGCADSASIIVSNPDSLQISISKTDISCYGLSDGSAVATVVGGTSPYSYQWNADGGLVSGNVATGLSAGNPAVTVTDSNGCSSIQTISLIAPIQINVVATSTSASCGNGDGQACVSISGGKSPYSIVWADPLQSTTSCANNLFAGNYLVAVTDANECVGSAQTVVEDVGAPIASVHSFTDVTCAGLSDGSATISVAGGTPPYSYSWTSGQVGSAISNNALSVGSHCVNVADQNNCIATVCVSISEPDSLMGVTIVKSPANCAESCDGQSIVLVSGGTPPYTYNWSHGLGSTDSVVGMCSDLSYSVQIKDVNNCKIIDSISLASPSAISISSSLQNPSCFGFADGSIDISVGGGTPPYSYRWNDGNTSEDLAGLASGNYKVVLVDFKGCEDSTMVSLIDPNPIALTISANSAHCGKADGSICVTPSGGDGIFTYHWSDPNSQTMSCASSLFAGSYQLQITDGQQCSLDTTISVQNIPGPAVSTAVISNASGNGLCDGEIEALASGGIQPYAYQWDHGNSPLTTAAYGLCAGMYCVEVEDAFGCKNVACAAITEPDPLVISTTTTGTRCFGKCNGTAEVNVSGGIPPYQYYWGHGATSNKLTGLCAGKYYITVYDANQVAVNDSLIISEPAEIQVLEVSTLDVSCFGQCNGALGASAIGGSGTLTYEWNSGSLVGSSQLGLCSGQYDLVITDDSLCQQTVSAILKEPKALSLQFGSTAAKCGQPNGQACVSVSGGSGGYTIAWNDPLAQSSLCASGLFPGAHLVRIQDANGCLDSGTVIVQNEPGPTAQIGIVSEPSCAMSCDGVAQAANIGGLPPFTYTWNENSANNSELQYGLCAGKHSVQVVDANGCISVDSVLMSQPLEVDAVVSVLDAACFGQSSGTAKAIAVGGTISMDYSYQWWDSLFTNVLANGNSLTTVYQGKYWMLAKDDNGCVDTVPAVVSQSDEIKVVTSIKSANCGQATGALQIDTILGGSGTFDPVIWKDENYSTVANTSAVVAGQYWALVADHTGCRDSTVAVVSDSSGPVLTLTSHQNARCFDVCDGSANVSISGGVEPYSINWLPAIYNLPDSSSVENLCADKYSVIAIDQYGCAGTITFEIEEPTNLSVAVTNSAASGYGICDGTIQLQVFGGTSPISYTWFEDCGFGQQLESSAANTQGLCVGSYGVVVSDFKGCSDSLCIEISQPDSIQIQLATKDTRCNGSCDGQITAQATGGVGQGYTYNWFSGGFPGVFIGQTSSTANNLCPGTYYVVVADSSGVQTISAEVGVGEPSAIDATVNITSNYNGAHISCFGYCDGSAEVIASGGIGSYSFEWGIQSGAQATAIANGLCSGLHQVVVQDLNKCRDTFFVTLVEPDEQKINISNSNVSCFGAQDGSVTATVAGGTGQMNYLWDDQNFTTSSSVSGLDKGDYCVVATDANGCQSTKCSRIEEPIQMNLSSYSSGAKCGQNSGTAQVIVTGGVGPFSYLWSHNQRTSQEIDSLLAGCYTVQVQDSLQCVDSLEICVQDLGSPSVSVLTKGNVQCYGGNDGFAQLSVSTAKPPLTYRWFDSTGSQLNQVTVSALGLSAGSYTGEMVDTDGCKASVVVAISQPDKLTTTLATSSDVSCFGECDGSASVIVSGGVTPYTFSWNDFSAQNSSSATNFCQGDYAVQVTDQNGCSQSQSVWIAQPSEFKIEVSTTDAFCGTASGTATLNTLQGGFGTLNYAWNNDPSENSSSSSNILSGNYLVTATDQNGCTAVDSFSITDIPSATATISNIKHVSCFGGSDGSLTVSMGGGAASPLIYQWFKKNGNSYSSINQHSSTCSGLTGGEYYVEVIDNNGCMSTSNTVALSEPKELVLNISATHVLCNGENSGTATVKVNGGSPGYLFQWNDPLEQVSASAVNLIAGNYSVHVKDGSGCQKSATVQVNEPTPITFDSTVVNSNCGQSDGSACIALTGGLGSYQHIWQMDSSDVDCQSNLRAGTYLITVKDNGRCAQNFTVEISDNEGPMAQIVSKKNPTCFGSMNGSATIDMISGNGSFFSVQWDQNTGGQITPTASNLSAGVYTVAITDGFGCMASASVTIEDPEDFNAIQSITDVTCPNDSNGSIGINIIGGTAPYTYDWRNATNIQIGNSSLVNDLPSGNYKLLVEDGNGCSSIFDYAVAEPEKMLATIYGVDISCFGQTDGKAWITIENGVGPFQYQWDDATQQTADTAFGLQAGSYNCVITDAKGCIASVTTTIEEPPVLELEVASLKNISCNAGCDGVIHVNAAGGSGNLNYSWNGLAAGNILNNLCAGDYQVIASDANGCSVEQNISLTQPQPLVVHTNSTDLKCFQECVGQVNAAVSGGVSPYHYQWNTPGLDQTSLVENLCAGSYSLAVTDQNGCIQNSAASISEPPSIGLSGEVSHASCGQSNGQIIANVYGGTSPYAYQWSDANTQTTSSVFELSSGCYTFSVIDARGCLYDSLICINDLSGPQLSVATSSDVSCHGYSNGSLSLNLSGGVGQSILTWSDDSGDTIFTGGNALTQSNLSGGCYQITAIDQSNCATSLLHCVSEPAQINAVITLKKEISCFESCNGSAFVTATGGVSNYSYSWSTDHADSVVSGLCVGELVVEVSDGNGCQIEDTISLDQPQKLKVVLDELSQVSCFNACDGRVETKVTGGMMPYTYSWTNSVVNSNILTNVCADEITLEVTDLNGCTDNIELNIFQPEQLEANYSSAPSTCGDCNGAAFVQPTGGTFPYIYQWAGLGNLSDSTATNLCEGGYLVNIVDANNCSVAVNIPIEDQPGPKIDSIGFKAPLCFGHKTGSATVYVSGGRVDGGGYSYDWDNGQISADATQLAAGLHCVEVVDDNNCSVTECIELTQPHKLLAVPDLDRVICFRDSTQLWASGQGGIEPYAINWKSHPFSGAGPVPVYPVDTTEYCFSISDSVSCQSSDSCVIVGVRPKISLSVPERLLVCSGDSVSIEAEVVGGTGGPYNFMWINESDTVRYQDSNQTSVLHIFPTQESNYIVQVGDGCSPDELDTVKISRHPYPVAFMVTPDSAGCPPFEAQYIATSDIAEFYAFNVGCDSSFEQIGPSDQYFHEYSDSGTYDVCLYAVSTIGCTTIVEKTDFTTVYPQPDAYFKIAPSALSLTSPEIWITDSSQGGVLYEWDFGDGRLLFGHPDSILADGQLLSGPTHYYQDTGSYTIALTIESEDGCRDSVAKQVHVLQEWTMYLPNAFTPNGDGINDVLYPSSMGVNVSLFKLYILDRWGKLIFESHNIQQGWDGKFLGKYVQSDVYPWVMTVWDQNNEATVYRGYVTVIR